MPFLVDTTCIAAAVAAIVVCEQSMDYEPVVLEETVLQLQSSGIQFSIKVLKGLYFDNKRSHQYICFSLSVAL